MTMMDAQVNYQESVNTIMQNFKKLKCEHTQLKQDYNDKELVSMKKEERLRDLERNRNLLIKLLNEKVEKVASYKATIQSLQQENNDLNTTIQDQNLLIDEYSSTIEKLKRENRRLSNKKNESKNVIEQGIKKSDPVKHPNGTHFSHPSFDPPTSEAKKKKKKSPLALQNRYSNLDISGNGIQKQQDSSEGNTKPASAKKRRLFSLEDNMIDLTINSQE